jgi:eukaryotic-like serine/threonine-protein kinase
MPLTSATRLGPYEIIARLGAGGMGEVYRARDTWLGREVAIKVLPDAVASHPDRLARLEHEARTVAALNHPGIVTLYAFEEVGGIRFLTMELVEGRSLDQLVTPGGLPLARVLELAIGLADALVAAHDRGIVHRDLKPGNVMVTGEGRVKVLDFGLAKLTQPESDLDATQAATVATPISTAGQTVGTVPYMAPEQVRGETVDARTDLFAFGIIVHELLVGRRPFGGATYADVTSAILRDAPPRVQALRPDVPRDLDRIVARCLEKDPRDRFQTARDVYNELRYLWREVVSGAPLGTPDPVSSRAPVAPPSTAPHTPAPPTGGVPRSSGVSPTAPDSSSQVAPSIAVLPFINRSRDEEDAYFSDGLADELLNVLTKIRGLRVAARTSAFRFRGTDDDLATIGRKLNVATLVEGSVRKSGNRVRIAVQLIKVADGYHLWSETYDRTLDDIFAVQDDIAQAVVKELRTTLMGETADSKASGEARAEVAEAAKGRGESSEAHRLFLQGRYLIDRLSRGENERGIAYLRQALELDPTHALAWATLSRALSNAAGYGWGTFEDGYRLAREAAERAVAVEPGLAEGHAMLGRIQMFHDWDWSSADASLRRALELAPASADAVNGIAALARTLGRTDEALRLSRKAVELDPLSPVSYAVLGHACRAAGRTEEAYDAFRKVLELAPQRAGARLILTITLLELGHGPEATAEAEAEIETWARLCALAIAHAAAGRRAESEDALRQLIASHAGDSAYQIAAVYAFRGEPDLAFQWLDHAFERRDPGLTWVKLEPVFRTLHGDPRWNAILTRLGLAG